MILVDAKYVCLFSTKKVNSITNCKEVLLLTEHTNCFPFSNSAKHIQYNIKDRGTTLTLSPYNTKVIFLQFGILPKIKERIDSGFTKNASVYQYTKRAMKKNLTSIKNKYLVRSMQLLNIIINT